MNNDVSKKRKKTSKEKRILIASLCIAAAVAAGSTFAWFTSKDEVTNRLSANASYNVSVVETFTPPTNWIPGQKVNKDTSAINTGNIEAFVKQKLEGVMQVTLEYADSGAFGDSTKTYVELTEDEVDVIEAGGFLAWASDVSGTQIGKKKGEVGAGEIPLGEISSVHSGAQIGDADFGSEVQFTPPVSGDYIFRRTINVNATDGTTDLSNVTEDYEYVGYRYDAATGKYYKIKNLNALQPQEDGILNAKPTVYYAIEKQEKKTLPLRYEPKGTVTTYTIGTTTGLIKTTVAGTDYYKNSAGDTVYSFDGTSWYGANNATITAPTVEEVQSPDRLVATYSVDKSDDAFLDNTNDLSNKTAADYDAELAAIAKSDYILAKVAYDNAVAQYNLNKNAYDAGVALLTAIKKNEETLNSQKIALNGVTCSTTIGKLEFTGDAASSFITEVGNVNTELGSGGLSSPGDITSVADATTGLKQRVAEYIANPTDANWDAVVTANNNVNAAFTSANTEIEKLESAIVNQWRSATVNDPILTAITNVSGIATANPPDSASDEAKVAKAAATQLKVWEGTLTAYQNAISNYYSQLSAIHGDAKYKLQDVSGLEKTYNKAAIATVAEVKAVDANGADYNGSKRAVDITTGLTTLSVDPAYKINNGGPLDTLDLNSSNGAPIKNAISNNGFAGTSILGITGGTQFEINDKTIADSPVAPSEPDATAYNSAADTYNKYQTIQTNQKANEDIVIYINLDNVGNGSNPDQWKLSPTLVPGATEANFYYTSVLGSGETTSILVDSVELSGDSTNVAYKDFDFDLNVTVDSAQVVVSEDGNYYEPTAVIANDSFVAKPTKSKYNKGAKPVKDVVKVDWN